MGLTHRLRLILFAFFCMEIMALGFERFDLSFDEIKQLTAADLQAKPKVEVYGQVIRFHSRDRGLFLFNGKSGIFKFFVSDIKLPLCLILGVYFKNTSTNPF